jgi:cytochrome c
MRTIVLLTMAAGALAGACASPAVQTIHAPGTASGAAVAASIAEGRRVFEVVCASCHSVEAPAGLAPPITHVARHYRDATGSADEAVAHLVSFVRQPSDERSLLPANARERWGLMPAIHLPQEQLTAVGMYLMSLPEVADGACAQPGGDGHRHGMGHSHGCPQAEGCPRQPALGTASR